MKSKKRRQRSAQGHASSIGRRYFMAAGAAVLASFGLHPPLAAAKRPNIVLFVADDLGLFFTSCYDNAAMRTPNIDRLAREGMRFNQAFTPTAICAPSRSVLYTGLYPHRTGAHNQGGVARPATRSLPHYLVPLGYRTALAGKSHVSPESVFPFERIESDGDSYRVEDLETFIRDAGDAPFCLVVASKEPHTPHDTGGYKPDEVRLPGYFVDTPETRQRVADYCTDINHVDRQIGEVLAMLERLDHADDTLVLFTSDHGEPMPYCKWTCYDGGIRVPFLAWWPSVIAPGTVSDAMIDFTDVVPTIVDVAGGNPDPGLDGRSFLPVLAGERDRHLDMIFAAHSHAAVRNGCRYPIRAVRTARYKYIVNVEYDTTFTNNITEGARDFDAVWNSWIAKGKTDSFAADRVSQYQHRPLEELYDLTNDPCELTNLAQEAERRDQMEQLRHVLLGWMAQQVDPELERALGRFS